MAKMVRLILRAERFWTCEVPCRGGGFTIPMFGIDHDGFAFDPFNDIEPQRQQAAAFDEAMARGASFEELMALPCPTPTPRPDDLLGMFEPGWPDVAHKFGLPPEDLTIC